MKPTATNHHRNWHLERIAEGQIAVMTLTRLPAGRVSEPVPGMAAAAWAFPLVGILVGGLGAIAYAIAVAANLPPALAALAALTVGIIASGAIHEDGLADVADGLGGGRDPAQKLAIMRDSHVGSYGVLALVLSLAVRAVCIATLAAPFAVAGTMIALAVASRAAMVFALYMMPPARTDGLGQSASQVGLSRCAFAVASGFAALAALAIARPDITMAATASVAVAIAVAGVLLAWLTWRQIGGQTGDVLGALQQFTEIAGWAAIVSWST